MKQFNCKEVRDSKLKQIKLIVDTLEVRPTLLVIQVGSRPDSTRYVRNKINRCLEVGIEAKALVLPETITTDELIQVVLEEQEKVSALIVQCPLPSHINEIEVLNSLHPVVDCDGLHPLNIGFLHSQQHTMVPATAQGIMDLFEHYEIDVTGMEVLLVGRSNLVNRPLYELLLQKNATPTIAHTKTRNLQEKLSSGNYDIVIGAIGQDRGLSNVNAKYIIDVGINVNTEGKLHGDFDIDTCNCEYYTPVPSGVGLLTQASVVTNILKCHFTKTALDRGGIVIV